MSNKPKSPASSTRIFTLLVVGILFIVMGVSTVVGAVMDIQRSFHPLHLAIIFVGAVVLVIGVLMVFNSDSTLKEKP